MRKTKHSVEAIRTVVVGYLRLKGWGKTEVAKNPAMWGRWMLEADKLLSELGGKEELAVECMQEMSQKWSDFSDWTIPGVTRRALDWLAAKQAEVMK